MLASLTVDGSVHLEDVVVACVGLTGEASAIDLHTLKYELRQMHRTQVKFYAFVEGAFRCMFDQSVSVLAQSASARAESHTLGTWFRDNLPNSARLSADNNGIRSSF